MNPQESFERAIVGDLPLGEAAAFFLRLKTAAKEVGPPDEMGVLEGKFLVPVEQVLAVMSELVKNEFESMYAYTVYSQSLRDLSHDSIASHFDEHSDDELDHANFLLKRMSVLGGPVHVPDLEAPKPSSNPEEIIQTMIRMEQDGIAGWRKLLAVVGDNPMKVTIEDYMAKEQEHLDDLWQLLPHQENMPVLQQKTAQPMEEDPAIAGASTDVGPYRQIIGHELLESRKRGLLGAGLGAGALGTIGGPVGVKLLANRMGAVPAAITGAVTGAATGSLPGLIQAYRRQNAYEALNNPEYSDAAPSVDKIGAVAPQKVLSALQKASPERVQRFGEGMNVLSRTAKMPGVRSAAEDAGILAGMGSHTPLRVTPNMLQTPPAYRPAALQHVPLTPSVSETLQAPSMARPYAAPPKYTPAYPAAIRHEPILPTAPRTLQQVPKYPALRHEPLLPTSPETLQAVPKVGMVMPLLKKIAEEVDINSWLAQEQMAEQAQRSNEAAYFKQQAQEAQTAAQVKAQEAQSLQQQMQQVQQQLQQMQGELDQSGQVQRTVLDRARQVEQQATQSAAAAHQAASAATLQAMQSSQEVLRHKMLTATMQQNVQGWKQQLMDVVQADPTSQAGEQISMPLSGPTPPQMSEVPTDGGPPIVSGPANQAATPPGTANAPTPLGQEQGTANVNIPSPEQTLTPATKQAAINRLFAQVAAMQKRANTPVAPIMGALTGAAVGGIGGRIMSHHEDPAAAAAQVAELEARNAQNGSFVNSIQLAKARLFRDLVEAAHEHPTAATLGGALVGGAMGLTGGNEMHKQLMSAIRGPGKV